jgi:hypothetical protein
MIILTSSLELNKINSRILIKIFHIFFCIEKPSNGNTEQQVGVIGKI